MLLLFGAHCPELHASVNSGRKGTELARWSVREGKRDKNRCMTTEQRVRSLRSEMETLKTKALKREK
jgi:hypothetical protein